MAVTNFPGGRGPLFLLVGVGIDANTRRAQKATCPRRDKSMGDAGHRVKNKNLAAFICLNGNRIHHMKEMHLIASTPVTYSKSLGQCCVS